MCLQICAPRDSARANFSRHLYLQSRDRFPDAGDPSRNKCVSRCKFVRVSILNIASRGTNALGVLCHAERTEGFFHPDDRLATLGRLSAVRSPLDRVYSKSLKKCQYRARAHCYQTRLNYYFNKRQSNEIYQFRAGLKARNSL